MQCLQLVGLAAVVGGTLLALNAGLCPRRPRALGRCITARPITPPRITPRRIIPLPIIRHRIIRLHIIPHLMPHRRRRAPCIRVIRIQLLIMPRPAKASLTRATTGRTTIGAAATGTTATTATGTTAIGAGRGAFGEMEPSRRPRIPRGITSRSSTWNRRWPSCPKMARRSPADV